MYLQAKIAKRGRKLMDYDGARHTFDSLASKKSDPAKLTKVKKTSFRRFVKVIV
jgi:hypothetical protein